MGYTSKDIAVITEPRVLSLAGGTNFVQFASKPRTQSLYSANIQVNAPVLATSAVTITEPGGTVHAFSGTTVKADVGGGVFYIAADHADTAENLRQALLADSWIRANFDIKIPFTWTGATTANGSKVSIVSKGYGAEFNIALTVGAGYTLTIINATSHNGDSISGEALTAEIDLDVYRDTPTYLGGDDRPISAAALGTYAITLQKTYAGSPLWFELNALFSKYGRFAIPPSSGWFNTDTVSAYRFVARLAGVNNYAFYQSNALYVLNGYGYASDTINLMDYVYTGSSVKLLTNKPRTPYVRGQKAFLNFIFGDPLKNNTNVGSYDLKIRYRAYTTADKFIGQIDSPAKARDTFNIVNTHVLKIDTVLNAYPTAGIVRVSLARGNAIVSNDIEYLIRPDCLHDLTQFIFLNRLGGWDAFNFDAKPREDIKAGFDTYSKAVTPAFAKGQSIETIYAATLDAPITIEGAPVTDDVAQWLKELAASKVVLDGAGNYIVKTDFTMVLTDATRNLQVPTIKYTLSETYTNE